MSPQNPLLNQLKDIHLPTPISLWPLAPGWYIVGILLIMALIYLLHRGFRYQKKIRVKRAALTQLHEFKSRYHQGDSQVAIMADLSILLKRVALHAYPSNKVAGLHGEPWLSFLDTSGETNVFSEGIGRVLITTPYQRRMNKIEMDRLLDDVRQWILKNTLQKDKVCSK